MKRELKFEKKYFRSDSTFFRSNSKNADLDLKKYFRSISTFFRLNSPQIRLLLDEIPFRSKGSQINFPNRNTRQKLSILDILHNSNQYQTEHKASQISLIIVINIRLYISNQYYTFKKMTIHKMIPLEVTVVSCKKHYLQIWVNLDLFAEPRRLNLDESSSNSLVKMKYIFCSRERQINKVNFNFVFVNCTTILSLRCTQQEHQKTKINS